MALVPDIKVKFSVDGDERELSLDNVTFQTWTDLKRQLGFTPTSIMEAVAKFDVEAIAALVWLERRGGNPTAAYQAAVREVSGADEFTITEVIAPEDREPDPTTSGENS